MAKSKRRNKHSKIESALICIIIVLAVVFALFYYAKYGKGGENSVDSQASNSLGGDGNTSVSALATGDLRLHFVDIGQGDCIIIQFPDGKTMIVDAGDNKNAVETKLKSYIDGLGITQFDFLLATHQDADHVGSLDYVLDNYLIKKAYRPNVHSSNSAVTSLTELYNSTANGGTVSTSATYALFLNKLVAEECEVEVFNKDSDFSYNFTLDGGEYSYTFDFLTPTADNKSAIKYSDSNNYSPIVALSYSGKTVILTGDAEKEVEAEYLNSTLSPIDCDVLKAGHHGSDTASTAAFIGAIKPEYAVIQCGTGNKYSHPHKSTLDTYYKNGVEVYRNDTNGDIVLTISIDGQMTFAMDNGDCSQNYVAPDRT